MIIYKATNTINGKCYIGQTKQELNKRILKHKSLSKNNSKLFFHNAIRKYKCDNFKWEILKECDSKEMLDIMETFMIIVHHSHMSENGYNMSYGGEGGDNISLHPNRKNIIKKGMYGKHHTIETIKKISNAKIGCTSPRKGIKLLDETKRKISIANKGNMYCLGRILSDETKNKISKSHRGMHHTEETKKKMSESRRRKYNYEMGY